MTVYVVIFHDVWDLGRDPGNENENGEPEETSIEGIYASRTAAEAAVQEHLIAFPPLSPSHTFHTIEEHPLIP